MIVKIGQSEAHQLLETDMNSFRKKSMKRRSLIGKGDLKKECKSRNMGIEGARDGEGEGKTARMNTMMNMTKRMIKWLKIMNLLGGKDHQRGED